MAELVSDDWISSSSATILSETSAHSDDSVLLSEYLLVSILRKTRSDIEELLLDDRVKLSVAK